MFGSDSTEQISIDPSQEISDSPENSADSKKIECKSELAQESGSDDIYVLSFYAVAVNLQRLPALMMPFPGNTLPDKSFPAAVAIPIVQSTGLSTPT